MSTTGFGSFHHNRHQRACVQSYELLCHWWRQTTLLGPLLLTAPSFPLNLREEVGVESGRLPDWGLRQMFPKDPHETFGSARSIQLSPLSADPTPNQVVIYWQLSHSLYPSVQDICQEVRRNDNKVNHWTLVYGLLVSSELMDILMLNHGGSLASQGPVGVQSLRKRHSCSSVMLSWLVILVEEPSWAG